MSAYVYIYRTSEGTRQEGEIEAPSRDEAFSLLRKQGIRPVKVIAKDGSKANGEVRGVRKRIVAACIVGAAILAGGVTWWVSRATVVDVVVQTSTGPVTFTEAQPLARQLIPGDRARIEQYGTNVFNHAAEFFLARFAEPGRPVPSHALMTPPSEAEFRHALRSPLRIASNDFTEHIDLKRIVTGIKHEMSAYLQGGGTVEQYIAELIQRQQMEISYREKAVTRLGELLNPRKTRPGEKIPDGQTARKNAYEFFLKANAQLAALGIYPIPMPDSLRAYQMSLGLDE